MKWLRTLYSKIRNCEAIKIFSYQKASDRATVSSIAKQFFLKRVSYNELFWILLVFGHQTRQRPAYSFHFSKPIGEESGVISENSLRHIVICHY